MLHVGNPQALKMNADRIQARIILKWLVTRESEIRQSFGQADETELKTKLSVHEELQKLANVCISEVIEYQSRTRCVEWA